MAAPRPIRIKSRHTGAAGAPGSMLSGEPAWNGAERALYIGAGDDGAGNAVDKIAVGGDGAFVAKATGVQSWLVGATPSALAMLASNGGGTAEFRVGEVGANAFGGGLYYAADDNTPRLVAYENGVRTTAVSWSRNGSATALWAGDVARISVTATQVDVSVDLAVAGTLRASAATTARAGLKLAPGAAPTTPVDGDIWTTSTHIFARLGGKTLPIGGPGVCVGRSVGTYTPYAVIVSAIPFDDTPPRSDEGTQVVFASHTASRAGNTIEGTFAGSVSADRACRVAVAAFRVPAFGVADCLEAMFVDVAGSGQTTPVVLQFEDTAIAGATNYAIRIGCCEPGSPAPTANIMVNGVDGARRLGGAIRQRLILREYAA